MGALNPLVSMRLSYHYRLEAALPPGIPLHCIPTMGDTPLASLSLTHVHYVSSHYSLE